MAYQQVGTPRFYIDNISWLLSSGFGYIMEGVPYHPNPNSAFGLNVSDVFVLDPPPEGIAHAAIGVNYNSYINLPYNFYAILGHRFYSELTRPNDEANEASYTGGGFQLIDTDPEYGTSLGLEAATTDTDVNTIINLGASLNTDYDGFTLVAYDTATDYNHNRVELIFTGVNNSIQVGKVIAGMYYDMPHSPDLSLTLSHEYDGVKTIQTRGGASLSNAFYTKPPLWGDLGAWELSDGTSTTELSNQSLSRSGRRIWDLSFSYLDDGDVFGSNQGLSGYDLLSIYGLANLDGYESSDLDDNKPAFNILTDNNFYSQVIHKTNGGQLPFVFQPNKNDGTNFAICKFDMKSFAFEQVANAVYNVKLKIREVW